MTPNLKWRLGKLPSPHELTELVNSKIITAEEAKDILLSEDEKHEPATLESLQAEVKLLRELVLSIMSGKTGTIYRIIERYNDYPWYKPYQVWCSSTTSGTGAITAGIGKTNIASSGTVLGTPVADYSYNNMLASSNRVSDVATYNASDVINS